MQQEIAHLKKENSDLSNKLNNQKLEESKYYDKTGQLMDTYKVLEQNLSKRLFESVRQILYGPNTPAEALKQ